MRRLPVVIVLLGLGISLCASAKDDAAEKARSSFLRAMKSEDVATRVKAVKDLGRLGTVDAAKLLVHEAIAKDRSGRVLDAAVRTLSMYASDEAVPFLVGVARKAKWHVRAMVIVALAARADPSPAYEAFLEAASDRDARIRTMGLFGLGGSRREDALPVLVKALEAKEWQVRVAAIEALRTLGTDAAVRPLVLRLREETGRLRGDISDALEDLTGKKFGLDTDLWLRWLEAWEKGEDEPAKAAPAPGEDAGASSVAKEPTYYGIKILSEKVIFIIDLSLSMKDPIEIDKRKLMGETRARSPRDGAKAEKKKEGPRFEDSIKWWKIKCGLDLAKAQLVFAIGQLDRRQSFEIIVFSDEAEAWVGRLVKATPMARARAANYVENLDVIGRTNSYAALDLAFTLAGKGKGVTKSAPAADTFFFLSDGAPSVGEFVKPGDILHEIANRNRTRKIKIHVIGLNVKVPFLRMLAQQNGGTYKTF